MEHDEDKETQRLAQEELRRDRTAEDVARGAEREAQDIDEGILSANFTEEDAIRREALNIPPRKTWGKIVITGLLQGLGVATLTVILIFVVLRFAGGETLARQVDRNAQISVEAAKGLRCVLDLSTNEGSPVTDEQIDSCYEEFDRLSKALIDDEGGG